jgi:sulfur carrier protein ThiS
MNIKQMIKSFSIGKKKENIQEVKAHVNVHAMLFGNYVNLDFDISVQSGTTVKKMVKLAYQNGEIEKDHYRYLKKLKPPFAVSLNGNLNESNPDQIISEGDQILIFTPVSGG